MPHCNVPTPSLNVQYSNQMTGTLPQALGLPEGLLSLRMGNNKFDGALPALKLPSTLQRCVAGADSVVQSCSFSVSSPQHVQIAWGPGTQDRKLTEPAPTPTPNTPPHPPPAPAPPDGSWYLGMQHL